MGERDVDDVPERMRRAHDALLALGRDYSDLLLDGAAEIERLAAANAALWATVEGDAELLARVGRRLKRLAMGPSDDGLGDECVARAALTDARIRAALDGGGDS